MPIKVIRPKKGSYCLRCGEDKKAIRKQKLKCGVYGTSYKRHIYK